MSTLRILDRDYLEQKVPSVFALNASARTSNKYQMYPTIKVVEEFEKQGWYPVKASQQCVRNAERQGFQKHLIRFRNHADIENQKPLMPEIVLTNSHDGTSAYQLMAGIFRLVCSNGLVVPECSINKISVMHKGHNPKDVIDASFEIIKDLPKAIAELEDLKSVDLTDKEQIAFATSAYALKYPKEVNEAGELVDNKFSPVVLLKPRRHDDNKNDLFTTFNRVQENIINATRGRNTESRIGTMRAVKSIDNGIKINMALWMLAKEMARLKRAF